MSGPGDPRPRIPPGRLTRPLQGSGTRPGYALEEYRDGQPTGVVRDVPAQSGVYTLTDYQTIWRKTSEALQKGVPLRRINRQLHEQTAGEIPSREALARLMARAGNAQSDTESRTPGIAQGLANAVTRGATLGIGGDREAAALFRQAHPRAAMAGELVGGLLPGMVGGEVATMPAGLGGKAMAGAAAGGLMGATQGAVEAPEGQRGVGAAIGGGLGAATGLLAMGTSPLWRRAVPGGPARLAEESGRQIARDAGLAGNAIEETQQALTQMRQALGGGPGRAPVVAPIAADVPKGRAPLEWIATKSPAAAAQVGSQLEERAVQMPTALESLLGDISGGAPRQSAQEATLAARTARRQVARTMYAPLENMTPTNPGAVSIAVAELTESPAFNRIWRNAQSIAKDRGYTVSANHASADFLTLQSMKQALDDLVNSAYKAGQGNRASALATRRDALAQAIRDGFGEGYDAANQAYRNATATVDAPVAGRRLWLQGTDPNDAARFIAGAPPEAVEAFKQAARDELRRRVLAVPRGANPIVRVFDAAGELGQQKLALIFEPEELKRIVAATDAMRDMGRTANAVVGNSRTAVRQAGMAEAGLTHPNQMPTRPRTAVLRALDPRTAEYGNRVDLGAPWLARGLLATDPAQQSAFLKALAPGARRPSLWDAVVPGVSFDLQQRVTSSLLGTR